MPLTCLSSSTKIQYWKCERLGAHGRRRMPCACSQKLLGGWGAHQSCIWHILFVGQIARWSHSLIQKWANLLGRLTLLARNKSPAGFASVPKDISDCPQALCQGVLWGHKIFHFCTCTQTTCPEIGDLFSTVRLSETCNYQMDLC